VILESITPAEAFVDIPSTLPTLRSSYPQPKRLLPYHGLESEVTSLIAFLIPDDAELDHMNGTVEIAATRSKVVQADEADEMHFALQAQEESSTIG